eukprot:m.87079 g.87079  ORF g.87079 m.87079 type:complete len:111 (+) comp36528_c1_seq12:71-403(+)
MSTPQSQMDDSKAESRPTNLRQRQQGVSTEISEEFRGPENQGENSLTTRNDPSGPSNFTNDSNLDNVPSMSNQMENTGTSCSTDCTCSKSVACKDWYRLSGKKWNYTTSI